MIPDESANGPGAALSNGSGAAAISSGAIGSLALATLAMAADKSATIKNLLAFYKLTGPLSGVTTVAVLIWLAVWVILERRWKNRNVALGPIIAISAALLGVSLLLTFPPFADIF